jgi:apolipoprotein N-acyltransferase
VFGLPAYLALYPAAGLALARLIWTRGATRILALALALTLAEWLRGHLLTGFPWNAYGYALMAPLVLAQGAALVGLWGMTFLAVVVFASPATLADDRTDTRRPWLAPVVSLTVLAALAIFGSIRLARTPTNFVDDVRLRIMQPNLQQDDKFNYAQKQAVMARYLALSERATASRPAGLRDVTLLIWPESAFPFFLTREADALAQIATLLAGNTVLITGGIRAPEGAASPVTRAYNSVYVIDQTGSVQSVYDKVHLVPFGEYLPFQSLLERLGLMQLTKVRGGFIAGDRHRPMNVPGAPSMLPLVCYEIIFPGEAVPRGDRPAWLLNLTNDGWFGISTGPYQHFQQARIRAIEEGLPLVRAANSGISAVVDPVGRVVASLPLGDEGVLDASLPQPVPPTIYARTGDAWAALMGGIALALVLHRRRRSRAHG